MGRAYDIEVILQNAKMRDKLRGSSGWLLAMWGRGLREGVAEDPVGGVEAYFGGGAVELQAVHDDGDLD